MIFADGLSPFGSGVKCAGSSPPSPLSDFAPIRFIAMFSVLCASGLSAPSDIPGVTNRLRIEVMLSTSSIGTGWPIGLISSKSRKCVGGLLRIFAEYCFHISKDARSHAACNICIALRFPGMGLALGPRLVEATDRQHIRAGLPAARMNLTALR